MGKSLILSGVIGSVLLLGTLDCHAEKWDKNEYTDRTVESAYYDADSVKAHNKRVSWTEKYIYNADGRDFNTKELSKYEACKERIAKKGAVTHFQIDNELEKKRYRAVAKRYYNKDNELVCSHKDMGDKFQASWTQVIPRSPITDAYYDIVTRYKVSFE